MEISVLKSETRQPAGRRANARLRRRGMVPAIIYGHGEPPEAVAVSLHELTLSLKQMAHVLKLDSRGDTPFLLKDVQYDHLQQTPLHVDLLRVDPNERVEVNVPVELKGTPKGAHEGGTLVLVLAEIEVECLLTAIPDAIRLNVSELGVGDSLHVRDLALPEGVKPLHEPGEIVAVVRAPRGPEAEAAPLPAEGEEAEGKEPEVFGRVSKKVEEEKSGD